MGRNHTKGISFKIIKKESANIKKSIVLIYDVPDYFDLDTSVLPEKVKLYRIKQYPGYLTDLRKFKELNHYIQSTFRKKTRYSLNRYQSRLELCFDISYRMYYGEIEKKDYDLLFDTFKKLLEKRFTDKQITNNNLNPEEWDFYFDVAFPMILKKQASLFVVYEGSNPIAISLNYFSEKILFHGITVFDIDYSKFNLGKIALKNLFLWCFNNQIQIFDFSKGYYDYKTHWSNKRYNFEYHLYFDRSLILIRFMAYSIKTYFELKQFLREKELNKTLHRLSYWFKRNSEKSRFMTSFSFSDIRHNYEDAELQEINLLSEEFKILKKIANEFLFLNKESLKDLKIMKVKDKESAFIFKGKKLSKYLDLH